MDSETRPFPIVPILVVAVLAISVVAAGGWFLSRAGTTAPVISPGLDAETEAQMRSFYGSLTIAPFGLVDQDAEPVSNSVFDGKRTILAFSFTNCPLVCPLMHSHLVRLQAEPLPSGVQIVTISVDPEHDTPEALSAYLDKLGVDQTRWRFLTGDPGVIRDVAASLKLGLETNEADLIPLKDGSGGQMANIDHPTRFILVDEAGNVEWMSDGLTWDGAQEIARLAAASQ